MIAYLSGQLTLIEPTHVHIECGGVGYFVKISLNTHAALQGKKNIKLPIFHDIKEGSQVLYGFASGKEKLLFEKLISVSGVGGSTALAMLSSITPEDFEQAIREEDVARLKSVKGIGAKTAGRIVLELKGKLPELGEGGSAAGGGSFRSDAIDALISLGFSRKDAEKKLDTLLRSQSPPSSVEEALRMALKN
ncbi:MAG: Holliday junction branch migration protein RuvA [Bacteroidota bacterium]